MSLDTTSNESQKPKARVAKSLQGVIVKLLKDDAAKKATPTLLDLLLPMYEGNSCVRQPGRLSIVAEGGAWRVSIECPTEGVQTSIMVNSLDSIQEELEAVLRDHKAHWGPSWKVRKKNLPTIDGSV